MITTQPIVYTAEPDWWRRLAEALGLRQHGVTDAVWSEWDGDGILAIHAADHDDPAVGTTEFHVLVDDLTQSRAALDAIGVRTEIRTLDDIGDLLIAHTRSGISITATAGARRAQHGDLSVMPIWYLDDIPFGTTVFEALGLRRRLASDSGGWVDAVADGGGLAALHAASAPRIELSFEYRGDVNALADSLIADGFDARIVDEAYNRTILVALPKGGDLWINGAIEDTYGYTSEES